MTNNNVTFYELEWDTDYFGVTSAKAILNEKIEKKQWNELLDKFKEYQFVSIINENSNPNHARRIGRDTSSFLVDVNIQFEKKLSEINEQPDNVNIYQALERNNQILELADFSHSKFIEDPYLANKGGKNVYTEWLINSFGKVDKFYSLSKNKNNEINGFALFSYENTRCIIELIAVSTREAKSGIGTNLFKSVEYEAYKQGINILRVGTQVKNVDAINFYHKVGCKQIECNEVYHLWNY